MKKFIILNMGICDNKASQSKGINETKSKLRLNTEYEQSRDKIETNIYTEIKVAGDNSPIQIEMAIKVSK